MRKRINIDKVFLMVDNAVMILILFLMLYPILYVIVASIASGPQNMTLWLIPKKFSWVGYKAVLEYKDIWRGYKNSLINTALGTVVSLIITMLCAYPLSRPEFKFRKIGMGLCMVTMYFSGGLIPTYLVVRDLGLLNTRMALILPAAMSVYNMIVTRTYIETSIPNDIRESAKIDGCNNTRYLLKMVIPLSKPILAVIGLFYAVQIWNSYFDAMIYVNAKRELYPLSLILRDILVQSNMDAMDIGDLEMAMLKEERRNVMKYATIVFASAPVMAMYPFVQKFFVKGMMIGSVKG